MSRPRRFSEVSGFVLAGGASRRMGFDKARLPLGSESMVDRQIRLLRAICRSVSIIGPLDRFADAGIQVYEDEIPGQGPLGGIHAGLRRARTEFSLFLSCDMPLMDAQISSLPLRTGSSKPRLGNGSPALGEGSVPTLCGIATACTLDRPFQPCVGTEPGGSILLKVQRRTISKAEFARAGFSPRIFYNAKYA